MARGVQGYVASCLRTGAVGLACAAVLAAAPAGAKVLTVPTVSACSSSAFTTTPMIDCTKVGGNALGGSAQLILNQKTGIDALAGAFQFDGVWGTIDPTKSLFSRSGNTLNFSQTLYGQNVIGAHFGNGSDFGNATIFMLFDFGSGGRNSITFTNLGGFSDAALYVVPPAVPEPSTWATMLLGFGALGAAMRLRRRKQPAGLQPA